MNQVFFFPYEDIKKWTEMVTNGQNERDLALNAVSVISWNENTVLDV